MKKLVTLIPAVLLAATVFASHPVAANAASMVATINGGGTANMDDGMGISSFGTRVTLLSDGSAVGEFDCVDHYGDAPGYPGNIFGKITRWSLNPDGSVNLYGTAKLVIIPGGLVLRDLPFTVTIQHFGGAGVGHWTLSVFGTTVCFETLISGQIVKRDT